MSVEESAQVISTCGAKRSIDESKACQFENEAHEGTFDKKTKTEDSEADGDEATIVSDEVFDKTADEPAESKEDVEPKEPVESKEVVEESKEPVESKDEEPSESIESKDEVKESTENTEQPPEPVESKDEAKETEPQTTEKHDQTLADETVQALEEGAPVPEAELPAVDASIAEAEKE